MKELFNEVLASFEEEDTKEMAAKCIDNAPDYFWEVSASSSFKYHPDFARETPLGLAKHTVAVCRYLNYLLEPECMRNQYTTHERDLLRIAAIIHDMWKSGNQEDYEKSKWTKFDHPLIASGHVLFMGWIPENDRIFISNVVSAHMGQWNTDKRSGIVLPKPTDKYQIILHLADYLASRKDIEMKFDGMEKATPLVNTEPLPDINTWRFTFGKYNGKTIPEIAKEDPQYIAWAKSNMEKEPARTLLKDFELKEK